MKIEKKYYLLYDWYIEDYYSWPSGDPRNGLTGVTVAVIDTGLNKQDWIDLENSVPYINIVAYVTAVNNGEIVVLHDPNELQSYEEGTEQHGASVVSALGAVAKTVDVVFIYLLFSGDNYGINFDRALTWLIDHGDEYNVQIVNLSASFGRYSPYAVYYENYYEVLYNKNYFMVTSAGNEGTQYNYDSSKGLYFFEPQNSEYWFTIGSIDYEDIGEFWDTDRYAVKDHWSGSAVDSYLHASWGDTTYSALSVDWVMPGNQVPAISADFNVRTLEGERKWYYQLGTSFSAPYFAGIVAILIDGYMDGYRAFGKTAPRLTIDKIVSFLMQASSLSSFNYKLGYGFVNAHSVYRVAYNTGYAEALPGGGIGPRPI